MTDPPDDRPWWPTVALVGGAFLVGLVIAIRRQPTVFYDDVAITLRYARRIADGDGWTYNDGDRTNGASAPLYTLLLAAASAVGIDLFTAVRVIGATSYAAALAAVAHLGARIAGLLAGALATVFLLAFYDFGTQSLSGMESAFAVVLGLAVVVALLHDRDTWAGVLLGLALVNKLDAGILAVAVAACYLALVRRPPWRIAAAAAAVLAPWVVFATVYFGSPLPYSFTQKATTDAVANPAGVGAAWIVDELRSQGLVLLVVLGAAALGAVPWLARERVRAALALATAVTWSLLHLAVFSLVDLGDRYPWYLTAIYPGLALGAGCGVVLAGRAASGRTRVPAIAALSVVSLLAVGVTQRNLGPLRQTAQEVRHGHQVLPYEDFERTRRAAAVRLAELVEPGDVIQTCFGWFAYEAPQSPIDELCPLNTRDDVGDPVWLAVATYPGTDEPELPRGAVVVETFTPPLGGGGRVDLVRLPEAG